MSYTSFIELHDLVSGMAVLLNVAHIVSITVELDATEDDPYTAVHMDNGMKEVVIETIEEVAALLVVNRARPAGNHEQEA